MDAGVSATGLDNRKGQDLRYMRPKWLLLCRVAGRQGGKVCHPGGASSVGSGIQGDVAGMSPQKQALEKTQDPGETMLFSMHCTEAMTACV